MQQKAREFWLFEDEMIYFESNPNTHEECIHVIEYSAFLALFDKYKALQEGTVDLALKNEALRKEYEELEKKNIDILRKYNQALSDATALRKERDEYRAALEQAKQEFIDRDIWNSLTDGMGEVGCFISKVLAKYKESK